jgi:hypothetical protein
MCEPGAGGRGGCGLASDIFEDILVSLRPIRLDHTKFSSVTIKQQQQLSDTLRYINLEDLDIICQVQSLVESLRRDLMLPRFPV